MFTAYLQFRFLLSHYFWNATVILFHEMVSFGDYTKTLVFQRGVQEIHHDESYFRVVDFLYTMLKNQYFCYILLKKLYTLLYTPCRGV